MTTIKWALAICLMIRSAVAFGAPVVIESVDGKIQVTTEKVAHVLGILDISAQQRFIAEMDDTAYLPGDRLIMINSPGGLSVIGDEMIAAIQAEQARGVRVVCVARHNASSMAFNLFTHCNVRLADAHASFTVHKLAFDRLDGRVDGRLTAKQLRKMADDMDKQDEKYRQANLKAMGLSEKDYDLLANNENVWSAHTLRDKGYLHGFVKD